MKEKDKRLLFAWRLAEEMKKVDIAKNKYHNACMGNGGVVESTYAVYAEAAINMAMLIFGDKDMLICLLCGDDEELAKNLAAKTRKFGNVSSGLPDEYDLMDFKMLLDKIDIPEPNDPY